MDLLAIIKSIGRNTWVAIPIAALTVAGLVYVALFQPKLYESTSTYLLLNPVTSAETAANPFLQLPDQSAIVGIMAERMASSDTVERLAEQGASTEFTVGPSQTYGPGSRILEVYAPGYSPQEALATADLVKTELQNQLTSLQDAEGVPQQGQIRLVPLDPASEAKAKVSSTLRSLIGVAALGGILMVLGIGIAEAAREVRSNRRKNAADAPDGADATLAAQTTKDDWDLADIGSLR